ncbi:MAG TPA: ribonuclease III [Candidatus Cloacimonas sp.]|jgi:ribonuclease-3|nr:ribonuclease III [Candidatus Cloacimonas sp.]HNQ39513.1 ribonuclease III [Candidatus Cloacimonas sp.]HNS84294.1 ribonuclease III [Candidatus Cloacimonas sp.]HPA24022.1 ribonuclease III [Candidatus Cloacimonas sp.]HPX09741.1 ribonuclease III [Candidatus Cloacimonas sp.]
MKSIISRILDYFNAKKIKEQYPKWEKSLSQLQKKIDYTFHNTNLLFAALTHKSYLHRNFEDHKAPSPFERMEFLGDSILGFIVSKELFTRHPEEQEGKLSKLKSKIVSETYLTLKANALDLGKYLLLSPEEQQSGGAFKPSILSDAMEALICAIYLDSGISAATRFIRNHILDNYQETVTREELVNYKSILQEYMQSRNQPPPTYVTVAEQGPEHQKTFVVEVRWGNKLLGVGKGNTKKNAHQEAARMACQKLGI